MDTLSGGPKALGAQDRVRICEVGPRDGLQNEAVLLAPSVRIELCRRLEAAGLSLIEAAGFVNPSRVPQMAGADEVISALEPAGGTEYVALVLNRRGYELALAAGARHLNFAFAVTDTLNRRNQGATVAESLALAAELRQRADHDRVSFTVTLGASFGCPFEGEVPATRVLAVADEVLRSPPKALVLADTIGVGVPRQVRALAAGLKGAASELGFHFHNTRNTGLANAQTAFDAGIRRFDASAGGAGGCPFAPGAAGNIPTEDLVYLFSRQGVETGVDLALLVEAVGWLELQLGRQVPGTQRRAGMFPPRPDAKGL